MEQETSQAQEPQIYQSATSTDNTCICMVMLLTFFFFASMALIIGFYGPSDLQLGPHCSILLQSNSLLVNEIKVQELDGSNGNLTLYGFLTTPPLSVVTVWSEAHNTSLLPHFNKEWAYYLNEGSEVNISYSVEDSSPLSLVISEGKETPVKWEDPIYPSLILSWSIIHGNGTIKQKIFKSSRYCFAIDHNLRHKEVKVKLNFSIRALSYDTNEACYECSLDHGVCAFEFNFLGASAAVLTSAGPEKSRTSDDWYVKLSYEPRRLSYFVGSGAMTVVILLVLKLCNELQSSSLRGVGLQTVEGSSGSTPLLLPKDDDTSSLGSSYESVSHDEDEASTTVGSLETKAPKYNDKKHQFCVICFDAPRDCFFLPCGHYASCSNCGTRIVEEAGTCPICRRKTKKVRKLFTV